MKKGGGGGGRGGKNEFTKIIFFPTYIVRFQSILWQKNVFHYVLKMQIYSKND